jgi:hypothetical protein
MLNFLLEVQADLGRSGASGFPPLRAKT